MKRMAWGLIVTGALGMQAAQAEEHRQLGAHVHGHGALNIAVDGTGVSMFLDVPGMDVLGFEHAPASDAERAAKNEAEAKLAKPLELFGLPAAAGCKVSTAKVEIEGGNGPEHDHDGHLDYNAAYELECASPGEITEIAFGYFAAFKGAQGLTVTLVASNLQKTYEVSRDKPALKFEGLM